MITTSSENLEPKRIMREHVGTAIRPTSNESRTPDTTRHPDHTGSRHFAPRTAPRPIMTALLRRPWLRRSSRTAPHRTRQSEAGKNPSIIQTRQLASQGQLTDRTSVGGPICLGCFTSANCGHPPL
jgi:hypothetical protein